MLQRRVLRGYSKFRKELELSLTLVSTPCLPSKHSVCLHFIFLFLLFIFHLTIEISLFLSLSSLVVFSLFSQMHPRRHLKDCSKFRREQEISLTSASIPCLLNKLSVCSLLLLPPSFLSFLSLACWIYFSLSLSLFLLVDAPKKSAEGLARQKWNEGDAPKVGLDSMANRQALGTLLPPLSSPSLFSFPSSPFSSFSFHYDPLGAPKKTVEQGVHKGEKGYAPVYAPGDEPETTRIKREDEERKGERGGEKRREEKEREGMVDITLTMIDHEEQQEQEVVHQHEEYLNYLYSSSFLFPSLPQSSSSSSLHCMI